MAKTYLGDAVYADVNAQKALVLTTEDGYRATNTIALEPEVLAALMLYTAGQVQLRPILNAHMMRTAAEDNET